MECQENFEGKTFALFRYICVPLCCTAVPEVVYTTNMKGRFQVQPSSVFLRHNPNVHCKSVVYNMTLKGDQNEQNLLSTLPDTADSIDIINIELFNTPAFPSHKRKKAQPQQARILLFITNVSSSSRVLLPKDHIVGFITPENPETNYVEISEITSVEEQCKNWVPPKKMLPKIPDSNTVVSPGDNKKVRKCATRKQYFG